jgi:methionine sulfoxide reductase catalytic subunit
MEDEVTPLALFQNRRRWLQAAAIAVSLPMTAKAYRCFNPVVLDVADQPLLEHFAEATLSQSDRRKLGFDTKDVKSSLYDISHLNNFQEFSSDPLQVVEQAKDFVTDGWMIEVGGLVERPATFTLDQIRATYPAEERVYRMRCVEAWSMVIPWAGFPLAALLDQVRPTSAAKFVAFQTLEDRTRFPNQIPGELQWPYREGLRIDEALNPLTLIATGLYRRQLPPGNGAPLRLVVPWKYGFKSIKSIVKIEVVAERPVTAWNQAAAHENGFFANVNPAVDHPRWSQATERRIGEFFRRDTLMFNGYEKQVAHLYRGMDLKVDF